MLSFFVSGTIWVGNFEVYFANVFNENKKKFHPDNHCNKLDYVDSCKDKWYPFAFMDALITAYTQKKLTNHRTNRRDFHQYEVLCYCAYHAHDGTEKMTDPRKGLFEIPSYFSSFQAFCQHVLPHAVNTRTEKKRRFLISFGREIICYHKKDEYIRDFFDDPDVNDANKLNTIFEIMKEPNFPTMKEILEIALKNCLQGYAEMEKSGRLEKVKQKLGNPDIAIDDESDDNSSNNNGDTEDLVTTIQRKKRAKKNCSIKKNYSIKKVLHAEKQVFMKPTLNERRIGRNIVDRMNAQSELSSYKLERFEILSTCSLKENDSPKLPYDSNDNGEVENQYHNEVNMMDEIMIKKDYPDFDEFMDKSRMNLELLEDLTDDFIIDMAFDESFYPGSDSEEFRVDSPVPDYNVSFSQKQIHNQTFSKLDENDENSQENWSCFELLVSPVRYE